MRTVTSFPHEVQQDEHVGIPMDDGVRLAARIWRPRPENRPVPAILEMIPYRKRDLTAYRDSIHHPYMAHLLGRSRIAEPDEDVEPSALGIESPLSVGQFAGK